MIFLCLVGVKRESKEYGVGGEFPPRLCSFQITSDTPIVLN